LAAVDPMPVEFEFEIGPMMQGQENPFTDVNFDAMADQMSQDQQELINKLYPEAAEEVPEAFLAVEGAEDEDSAPEQSEDEEDDEDDDDEDEDDDEEADEEAQGAKRHWKGKREGRHGDRRGRHHWRPHHGGPHGKDHHHGRHHEHPGHGHHGHRGGHGHRHHGHHGCRLAAVFPFALALLAAFHMWHLKAYRTTL